MDHLLPWKKTHIYRFGLETTFGYFNPPEGNNTGNSSPGPSGREGNLIRGKRPPNTYPPVPDGVSLLPARPFTRRFLWFQERRKAFVHLLHLGFYLQLKPLVSLFQGRLHYDSLPLAQDDAF